MAGDLRVLAFRTKGRWNGSLWGFYLQKVSFKGLKDIVCVIALSNSVIESREITSELDELDVSAKICFAPTFFKTLF